MILIITLVILFIYLNKKNNICYFFFFQAEDGIRDRDVTGVRRVLFRSAVPEPESWAVDAQDAAFAQTLEFLGQLGRVGSQEGRERLGGERLRPRGGGQEHAVGRGALGSAAGQQRFGERGGEFPAAAAGHCLGHEVG